jgi:tetratricopeptide (TPR) repeat protein
MSGRERRPFIRPISLAGAAIALALGAGVAANAEKVVWPWEQSPRYRQAPSQRSAPSAPSQQTRDTSNYRSVPSTDTSYRPVTSSSPSQSQTTVPSEQSGDTSTYRSVPSTSTYRSVPSTDTSYRSVTSSPPSQSQTTAPITRPSQYTPQQQTSSPPPSQQTSSPSPAQPRPAPAANPQPASNEPQRRPQTIGSNAGSAQAAATCMNERKSASVETAIKSCDTVIDETTKNLANAYYFRASARIGKSDLDGAIGDYGQALRLDPADADYFNNRAAAYEAKNDMDKAFADYNAAIKANPKSVTAYNSRAAAYQRKGDYARAAADYGEVTRLQPNNIDAWGARCWVRALTPGQTQMALSDCNTALKIKPDAADVLDSRGFVYLKLGQTDNAIKDYDTALKLDPKLAGSFYGRGVAKARKGDKTGSDDVAAAKAIKSDIADEFARYGLRP